MAVILSFPEMNRNNTALIIIDMQHDFLDDDGPVPLPRGRMVIPAIQRVLSECRELKIPVIHVNTVWRKDGADISPLTTSDELRVRGLREGEPGTRQVTELSILENEYVVIKKRYSAFYQTDLELLLRRLGIIYLLMTGIATNYCVRATVHDATYRDFMPVVLSDCVTSYTDEEHAQSLSDIKTGFGQVRTTNEVLLALRGLPATR